MNNMESHTLVCGMEDERIQGKVKNLLFKNKQHRYRTKVF